jgi:hypothetical protein
VSGRTAILIVNGYDQVGLFGTTFEASEAISYPWIELCLREVERRSRGADYEVFVWDNSRLSELRGAIASRGVHLFPSDDDLVARRPDATLDVQTLSLLHAASLHRLLANVDESFDYVATLDTDAFPIKDGWLDDLHSNLASAELTGIWRDEMAPRLTPFVHPSCMCLRRERLLEIDNPFSFDGVQDAGQWITNHVLLAGERIAPLRRTNARNAHFLMGGIYGDLIYHQGAGSRRPMFRLTEGDAADNNAYELLREAAFGDIDHLVAVLSGRVDDDIGFTEDRNEPWARTAWPGYGLRKPQASVGSDG